MRHLLSFPVLLLSSGLCGQIAPAQTLISECAEPSDPVCRFAGAPVLLDEAQPIKIAPRTQDYFPTTRAVSFVDGAGRNWTAPPATLTDGASIPDVFVRLIGDRRSPEFMGAATIHDAYCGLGNENGPAFQTEPWEDVHRMFYDALVVDGTPKLKAKIMFAAVYLGGPRWDDPQRDMSQVPDDLLLQEMEWCIRWINEVEPTRERIVEWMDGREADLRAGTPVEPDFEQLRELGPLPLGNVQ